LGAVFHEIEGVLPLSSYGTVVLVILTVFMTLTFTLLKQCTCSHSKIVARSLLRLLVWFHVRIAMSSTVKLALCC
jgi:hypothetical protein